MFDYEAYLAAYNGRRSMGEGGLQFIIQCPWCGNQDFYVAVNPKARAWKKRDTRPGDFICFKGRCGKAGSFLKLYAELEGFGDDLIAARAQLTQESGGMRRRILPPPPRAQAAPAAVPPAPVPPAREVAPEAKPSALEKAPARDWLDVFRAAAVAPISKKTGKQVWRTPSTFVPVWDETRPEGEQWSMPQYLLERGMTRRTAARFGIGYSEDYRYAGRIVLPVVCPAGVSFTTRALDPDDKLRYLSGPGAGQLVFGWPQLPADADELVLVEGPFDATSVYQARLPVLGLMGKSLREAQVLMMRQRGFKRYVLMLDGDALADAIRQAHLLGAEVYVAGKLTGGAEGKQDPGNSSPEQILSAYNKARPVEEVRLMVLRERLAATRR
jgi:hypothetical protein